jgi:hypothetical protein
MRMETLLKLAGSENASPRSAQQKLRKALYDVAQACAAHGEGFSYEIRGDLVHVEKNGLQQRRLAKKSSSPRKPRA